MALIEVEHLSKDFDVKNGSCIHAVHDVSFSIEQGEIFGVIGLSGAGKSTLVRCLNLLERPSGGSVRIDGRDLVTMSEAELRKERQRIGMIFQHFNLLMQRNVIDNVCFPMEIAGIRKKDARIKAAEYLEAVGLTEKAKAYPVQLSGGQQQRVAIARVLASNPRILLCDEATSALDPQTTREVLALLKKINQEYGITIIVITHAMSVIEEICGRVAVLEKGRMVEIGKVQEVFANPQTRAAKRLLLSKQSEELLEEIEQQ